LHIHLKVDIFFTNIVYIINQITNQTMETTQLNEKESLALITAMIQTTRTQLGKGSGNQFLIYGGCAVILANIIYILVDATQNPVWNALWFLMFTPGIILSLKKDKPKVITYTDRMICDTWKVVGSLFLLTTILIFAIGFLLLDICNFSIMMPLSIIYAAIGTSITGIVIKDRYLTICPLFCFIFSIYMLMGMVVSDVLFPNYWNLLCGISFLIMMVIPGLLLNKKSQKVCSKN